MANSFTQTVDLAPVQTVVDAIRATDVPVLTTHLTDIKGAAFATPNDSLNYIKNTAYTVQTKVTDMQGTGFVKDTHSLTDIENLALIAKNEAVAVRVTTDKLDPLLPPAGEIETIESAGYITVSASDVLKNANDSEQSHDTSTYTKKKEVVCPVNGTLRIKFDLKGANATNPVYGKVYKDGIAHGAEQSITSDTYVTKSEDLVFAKGDLIQLYIKVFSGATHVYIENFRFYCDYDSGFHNVI